MRVYLLWHGGSSYSVPSAEDVETFDSLKDLKHAFWSRADYDPYYPCVTEEEPEQGGPEGWVFFSDPRMLGGDLYPDRLIMFGPRGGLRVVDA